MTVDSDVAVNVLRGIAAEILARTDIDDSTLLSAYGADSITLVRIIGRARMSGLAVDTAAAFREPSLAAMAAGCTRLVEAAAPAVAGPVPLSPAQRLLLEIYRPPDSRTISLAVNLPEAVTPAIAARAMATLVERHDALRLRLAADQRTFVIDDDAPFAPHLFAVLSVPDGDDALAVLGREPRSMSPARAPLVRARLAPRPDGVSALLLVLHHLIVDASGIDVLLDDLETVLEHLTGARADLPPASRTGQIAWCRWLANLHEQSDHRAVLDQWSEFLDGPIDAPMPVDFDHGPNRIENTGFASARLGQTATDALRAAVNRDPTLTLEGSVLAALASGFTRVFGAPTFVTTLSRSGRRPVPGGPDASATVGWLTYHFPVRLTVDPAAPVVDATRAVCRLLAQVPAGGLTFSALHYYETDPEVSSVVAGLGLPQSMVIFNGDLGTRDRSRGWIREADLPSLPRKAATGPRTVMFQIRSEVHEGRAAITITYSRNHHKPETVDDWLVAAMAYLTALGDGSDGQAPG